MNLLEDIGYYLSKVKAAEPRLSREKHSGQAPDRLPYGMLRDRRGPRRPLGRKSDFV